MSDALSDQPECKRMKLSSSTMQKTEHEKSLSEEDVGIKCYITSGFEPVPGIVKQRFSDFVVNEIDMNGGLVQLKELSSQPPQQKNCDENLQKTNSDKQKIDTTTCPVSEERLTELRKLVELKDSSTVRLEAPDDKDKRREIHVFIKTHFSSLCSNCVEIEGRKYLDVTYGSTSGDVRNRSGGRGSNFHNAWPKDRPPYLHFVLYKEFKDTMEAIDIICKYTHIKPNVFSYAGTKDRRAKTSQRVCAHKVTIEKLQGVNKRLQGIAMGNFTYQKEKVCLGQLSGNKFKIVLRNVTTSPENLSALSQSLKSTGFINYFGMQRFGTTSIPTYEVGKLMLKGELDKALDLIMSVRNTDSSDVVEVKKLWLLGRDSKVTLEKLPKSCNIERRLMQGICRVGVKNLPQAFESLPSGAVLLVPSDNCISLLSLELPDSCTYTAIRVLYGIESLEEEDDDATARSDRDTSSAVKRSVKRLTEQEVENYDIREVLIPLPGYKIDLPDNKIKDWMEEMLAEDNLTLDSLKSKYKDYRLPGSYRHIIVKPSDITSSLAYYDDVTEELVQSDMDILKARKLDLKSSGKYQAAILEFSLPSSSYATMLLREVMRIDTSAQHHTKLNSQFSKLSSTT